MSFDHRATDLLTLREREVMSLLCEGRSNKEISAELGISSDTVAVHAKNIYRKLQIKSRRELVNRAARPTHTRSKTSRKTLRRYSQALYVMALDQGTTSSRAIIFDRHGQTVATAQKELEQFYPKPGWVEQDGLSIWSTQSGVASEALAVASISPENLAAIGITNQRETTLVWDKQTGQPIHPAIVWQDRRTTDLCEKIKRGGHTEWIRAKTGLVPDAYFSATKLKWILDHVKGARKLANAGRLLFGTVDTWLVWNCTHGEVHVTDASNASRTMLYNIHTGAWDEELLEFFNIPPQILPQVRSSSEVYGVTQMPFLMEGIPVAGIAGDQQAALFGQQCLNSGMVKNTYGTGCFMMMNTGTKPIRSRNNLLTTIAWQLNGKVEYALEGSIFIAGAAVQWLRDGLGILRHADEVETLARSVPDNHGVYLVPAFAGLGAPHWNQHARGMITGLTRGANAGHIARATLESIAFQTRDVLKAMEADSRLPITELRADGGATINRLLMQFQADILGVPVACSKTLEATALGAAMLAGLAVGFWPDLPQLATLWQPGERYQPTLAEKEVRSLVQGWRRALRAANAWAKPNRSV